MNQKQYFTFILASYNEYVDGGNQQCSYERAQTGAMLRNEPK